ncbi:MAG: ParB/RepB/Spo0J family partition protein [Coriobacteriia bacterium]|nr:ParB/RepB/Spo0J family partition protein [Coriobacteriia bacterium]
MVSRKRTGLGRGLNALLSAEEPETQETEEVAEEPAAEAPKRKTTRRTSKPKAAAAEDPSQNKQARIVPIDKVAPNPDQPRTQFIEEELDELAESIRNNGLLQPILVREVDGSYQIIAGERRWQACNKIGLKEIPVNIVEADDAKSLTLAMIENIQRSDLNPMEEAYGYRTLMEREKLTQAQLATAVSKGRSTIANSLRLLELPEDAQKLLFDGEISAGHARAILSVPTEEGRELLTKKLAEQKVSVREAENLARLYAGRKTEAPKRVATPKTFKKVAKGLRDALGTNVRVKTVGGKNKIEIEFKDEEELKAIFEKMVH